MYEDSIYNAVSICFDGGGVEEPCPRSPPWLPEYAWVILMLFALETSDWSLYATEIEAMM